MTRFTFLLATLAATAAGLTPPPARADDKVVYVDRAQKKEVTTNGTVSKESPAGITLASRDIPAADIVDIVYDSMKAAKLDYGSGFTKERAGLSAAKEADRKKGFADALASYKDALKNVAATAKPARRLIEYRIAALNARVAEEDGTGLDAAIKELTEFKSKNADGWQIVSAYRTLARLQMKHKDPQAAMKTYEELSKVAGVSKDVQQDCDLQVADVLLRDKATYAEAEAKLTALVGSLSADDPQQAKAKVYLTRCVAAKGKAELQKAVQELQALIDGSRDPELKAVAYNTLGDCYMMNSQPRDALWAYLFVDLIYNQNHEQHVKALTQLAAVFKETKDLAKAKEYEERARR